MATIPPRQSGSSRPPTLTADCHISNQGARVQDDLFTQAVHSQVCYVLHSGSVVA